MLTLVGTFILLMAIGVYALPHESFSEEENRPLASMPRFDISDIADGTFFASLSAFYSDALPLRTQMIRLKAACELASGKMQNNGVLFSRDGRLVDRCEYENDKILQKNLQGLASLLNSTPNSICVAVPRSVDIYTESDSAKTVLDTVEASLGSSALADKLRAAAASGERVYYKTDHHLDVDGAYILYAHIVESLGVTPYERSDLFAETFCTDFCGSIYSKGGLICAEKDTVTLLRYDGDTDYTVYCEDEGCTLDSLYSFEAREHKDKYCVFTDGNHGVLHVGSSSGETRPSLLVIKDSFANAVLPLLARHFDLVVYDPRYTDAPLSTCDYIAAVVGIDTLATTGRMF